VISERPTAERPDARIGAGERRAPARWVTVVFLLGALAAGLGFGVKLYEFAEDLLADQGIGFAGAHLITYALVAAGFVLLLLGTFLRGHWADIEKPKFELIEKERAHDRNERPGSAAHA